MKIFLRKDYILPLFWLFYFVVYSGNDSKYHQTKKTDYTEFKNENRLVSETSRAETNEVKAKILRVLYVTETEAIK